ncbi:hypothetical protein RJ639_042849 [Escallonia herrerae]|uniref:Transmembrane protein 131-like N-terminal domain-containing protein n=1 Tax=Escallonia herrerae TaxID=1293975 RepID=A0AA88WDC4_9ASTE|nr:hypothetical protein RJ639_042849 [Escallonia herrerae]
MNEIPSQVEYDACGSYRENVNSDFRDAFGVDIIPRVVHRNSIFKQSLDDVCTSSNLFCFPSTLPGFSSEEDMAESVAQEVSSNNSSWSASCGFFRLLGGRVVSCSSNSREGMHDLSCHQSSSSNENGVSPCIGPLVDQKPPSPRRNENSVGINSVILDGSLSLNVDIRPTLLDWGQTNLYFPSLAYLTVVNTHSDNILNVYEPYCTNSQFYARNFSELKLGPGEVASICFVFLPTLLGLSSAHLILQTSFGGFFIQARGFAIESPYGIQPITVDIGSSGRWRKNLSLFNPFDDTLYVEGLTAWISYSEANTSHSTKAICHITHSEGSADLNVRSVNEWFDVKGGADGLPVMAVRPHRNWEVRPHSSETIMEIDFPYHSQGKVLGAFCMQLLRSSKDKVDTVMVPLEAELGWKQTYDDLTSPVSVSLEVLGPCEASGPVVVALSLKNSASYLLSVVKISGTGESTNLQIKYMEGLLLFPSTVTQAAVVTYTPIAIPLHDISAKVPNANTNCGLFVLMNDSSIPHIVISCSDIDAFCSINESDSSVGDEHHSEKAEYSMARTWSLDGGMLSPSWMKASEIAETDEMILENWRSQGTVSGMSVLDDQELLFTVVPVGSYCSKWVTVRNPSHLPVLMQLILNSGEIIDDCRDPDGLLQPSSSSSLVRKEHNAPRRYGFSIAENAVTETYVHPNGTATFGPIFFHPSSRCGWSSSALIRNNLSGVEWLSLRGFGGSHSLVLFEGSEPVQTIEFKFSIPSPFNSSPADMEDTTHACSQPFSKELYAKNTGDLPLEVSKIEISGADCRLDGFVVRNCKGFALEPGESTKLVISYQTDLSAAVVQRDLELALTTGIIVIPMKVSLPTCMLNFCKTSILWTRVKKSSVAFLLASSILLLVFCCILPQAMVFGSQEFKSVESSIATIRRAGNSSRVHRNQENSNNFDKPTKINSILRSIGEEDTVLLESVGKHPDGQGVAVKQGKSGQRVNSTLDCHTDFLPHTKRLVALPSSSLSKSVDCSDKHEASEPGNLTVKVGKEKGRRRRRKRSSNTGFTGQFEVSSSQSGNSTPSSPLSPVTSFTPKRSWPLSPDVDQFAETKNPFANVTDRRCEKSSDNQPTSKANVLEPKISMNFGNTRMSCPTEEKHFTTRKTACRPALSLSATFPSTGRSAPNLMCPSPVLTSTSPIAPYARAPGSKLYDVKTCKTEEKMRQEDGPKYDIWGDHLFGLHLTGRSKSSAISPLSKGSTSNSFFVRDPQILMTNSRIKSVGSLQEG